MRATHAAALKRIIYETAFVYHAEYHPDTLGLHAENNFNPCLYTHSRLRFHSKYGTGPI